MSSMESEEMLKSEYYTLANIDEQSRKIANKLSLLREKHKNQVILPQNVALLVIDMQGFFYEPEFHAFVPSMLPIVPKVKGLQEYFLKRDLPVFQTQHGNTLSDSYQMLKWWGSIVESNSPFANIVADLKHPKIPVTKKTQNDAFWKTDLEERLRSKRITQVIITGVMTHLCCESTARSAFIRGFEVFFAIDGTATYNLDFHFGTLLNMAHGFARPMLIDEIMSEIENSKTVSS